MNAESSRPQDFKYSWLDIGSLVRLWDPFDWFASPGRRMLKQELPEQSEGLIGRVAEHTDLPHVRAEFRRYILGGGPLLHNNQSTKAHISLPCKSHEPCVNFSWSCLGSSRSLRSAARGPKPCAKDLPLPRDSLEARRSLKRYDLGTGERRFHVWLESATLGLSGKLDLLIITPKGYTNSRKQSLLAFTSRTGAFA
jgi:hypothetical protein